MKRILLSLAVALSFAVLCGSELSIVKAGKSDYCIAIPENGSSNLMREYRNSAQLLRELISRRTGVKLQVVSEKEVKPGKPAIYVGHTAAAAKRNMQKSWKLNEYRMKADKGDIFLLGDDNDPTPGKRAGNHMLRLGSVKALLEFAKKFAGADFLYQGRDGICVEKNSSLTAPADLAFDGVPYTMFGIGRSQEQYYAMANDMLPAPWYKCHGGHSHIPAIPPAKYLKSNPEYFAVVKGKRNGYPSIPQYCLSNPEVRKLIYNEVVTTLANPRYKESQLAQTDGFRICECAPCKEFFKPGAGEAIWNLHLDMAKRLLKDRPGKSVRIIAYGPTVNPPKNAKFPENVSVTIAAGQRIKEDYLKRWKACNVPRGFDVYLYNWGEYHTEGLTPTFSLKEAQAQTAMFRKYGINGIYFCGLSELPGLNSPVVTYYLRAFAGDKTAPEKFLNTFCTKSFGSEAGKWMEKFYSKLYSRIDLVKAGNEDYTNPLAQKAAKSVFAPNVALLHRRYPAEVLKELEDSLANAEKSAAKGKELLKHARLEFNYLKLTAGGCNAFYDYHANPGQKEFEALARIIVERKKFILSLPTYKLGKQTYLKGQGTFVTIGHFPVDMVMENGRLGAPLKAPFNWDVEFFLEKKMRPSGRVLKVGDSEWQQMIDIFADKSKTFVKEHPLFVRARLEGEELVAEMRFDNLPEAFHKGTIEVRLQKDTSSPRYRIWGSSLGGRAAVQIRTKIQQGNDYSDTWNTNWKEGRKYNVMMKRITAPGKSPVTEIRIPLSLFGGPATKGEKRMIDFVFHVKQHCYTWEYNINLLNWRHRYTSIGTLEF